MRPSSLIRRRALRLIGPLFAVVCACGGDGGGIVEDAGGSGDVASSDVADASDVSSDVPDDSAAADTPDIGDDLADVGDPDVFADIRVDAGDIADGPAMDATDGGNVDTDRDARGVEMSCELPLLGVASVTAEGDAAVEQVAIARDGSVVVAFSHVGDSTLPGGIFARGVGGEDVAVVVFESDGTLRWSFTFAGPRDDRITSVATADDGDVLVTAVFREDLLVGRGTEAEMSLSTATNTDADGLVARFDGATGDMRWVRQLGGANDDAANAAVGIGAETLVAGSFVEFAFIDGGGVSSVPVEGRGGHDIIRARYDADGTIVSVSVDGGSGDDRAIGLAPLGNDWLLVGSMTDGIEFDVGDSPALVLEPDLPARRHTFRATLAVGGDPVEAETLLVGEHDVLGVASDGERLLLAGWYEGELRRPGRGPIDGFGGRDGFLLADRRSGDDVIVRFLGEGDQWLVGAAPDIDGGILWSGRAVGASWIVEESGRAFVVDVPTASGVWGRLDALGSPICAQTVTGLQPLTFDGNRHVAMLGGGAGEAFDTAEVSPGAGALLRWELAENLPPVVIDDVAEANPGRPVAIDPLANDSDPEGDVLRILAIDEPMRGSFEDEGDALVYRAEPEWLGETTVGYTVSDGYGGETDGEIRIAVVEDTFDDPPTVAILQPEFDVVSFATMASIVAFVDDDFGVGTVELTVDDGEPQPLEIDESSEVRAELELAPGTSVIRVTVTDTGGQQAFAERMISNCFGSPLTSASWTGAQDSNWSSGRNWSPEATPNSLNRAFVCGAITPQPTLTRPAVVRDLSMDAEATVSLDGYYFSIVGSLASEGVIEGPGSINLTGVAATADGVVPDVGIFGTSTVTRRLESRGGLRISGTLVVTEGAEVVVDGDISLFNGAVLQNEGTVSYRGRLFNSGGTIVGDEPIDAVPD